MTACAPVGILQDARLVPKGRERVGIAGALFLPLSEGTYFNPDGMVKLPDPDQDLQYIPLAHLIGWARFGFKYVELQTAFSVPAFIITVGGKVGIVGARRGSPFALSLSAELNLSMMTADAGAGATLLTSVMLVDHVSLDLSVRVGNYPALWSGLSVTPTLGVSWGSSTRYHLAAGGVVPTGIGEVSPGLWLGAGASF